VNAESASRCIALSQAGAHAEALACFDRALAEDPANVDLLNNCAVELTHLRRPEEAIKKLDQALRLKPDFSPALCNRGLAKARMGAWRDALADYELVLQIEPGNLVALEMSAEILKTCGRLGEALSCLDKGIALAADPTHFLLLRGYLLIRLKRHDEALLNCERLLRLCPDSQKAHVHRAMTLLQMGRLEEGFREYEWRRLDGREPRPDLKVPLWTGRASVKDKAILLHCEQGLGDLVQFCRYVPIVADIAARVVLEVPKEARPLVASLEGRATIVDQGSVLPPVDFQCPLLSLPAALGTTADQIPAEVPYLAVDAEKVQRWRIKLDAGRELIVGLCWRGNPLYPGDKDRSTSLADMVPLIVTPGITFVSLQKDLLESERALAALLPLVCPDADLQQTSELVAALDLVISVDTVWAHWAGALGRPLWMMLADVPHWIWFLDRDDSPWYPSARLFRQTAARDWASVVGSIRAEFEARTRGIVDSRQVSPVPGHIEELNHLANSGQLVEAEALARKLTAASPDSPLGWRTLGEVLAAQGHLSEAAAMLRIAVNIAPDEPGGYHTLAQMLQRSGQLEEAASVCQRLLSQAPNDPVALVNLGHVQRQLRLWPEAEQSYRDALTVDPSNAGVRKQLGNLLSQRSSFMEAEACYRTALTDNPQDYELHNNLGNVLDEQGRRREAEDCYRAALRIRPAYHEAHCNLGTVLRDSGRWQEAEASFREAIRLKPDYADALGNIGGLMRDVGRVHEAEDFLRRALEANPQSANNFNVLGALYKDVGLITEAISCYRRAIAIRPDFHVPYSNLGNAYADLGDHVSAEASYRTAIRLRADYAPAHDNLLFMLGYGGLCTPEQYLAEARTWERDCVPLAIRQKARATVFARQPRGGRRLRIGYVSGDFRNHPVCVFLEEILRNHDRRRFEIHAYSTFAKSDKFTEGVRGLVDQWHLIDGCTDEEAVARISSQEVDVLVDLSGHTAHNRLGIFARRAAPVQCHYLGYFASTGLSEIDYWIGDGVLTPPALQPQFSESIWPLPRVWVSYTPPPDAPEPSWSPSGDGMICLGSFNHLSKITARTVEVWARALQRMPKAVLLLKTRELNDPANRSRLSVAFQRHGIAADRLQLVGRTADWKAHMALYERMHLALDPVGGIGGGTTTCDALWMGVPVITKLGGRHADRMTSSMLSSIGCDDWIAESDEAYIEKVVALASDHTALNSCRRNLRQRMRDSQLCNGADLARTLEQAFCEMFDIWYKGQK
jgi:protein O-GlcNAc transferase